MNVEQETRLWKGINNAILEMDFQRAMSISDALYAGLYKDYTSSSNLDEKRRITNDLNYLIGLDKTLFMSSKLRDSMQGLSDRLDEGEEWKKQ